MSDIALFGVEAATRVTLLLSVICRALYRMCMPTTINRVKPETSTAEKGCHEILSTPTQNHAVAGNQRQKV